MFDTKVGPLKYNVREVLDCGPKIGERWSSLGYARTLAEAKAKADRSPLDPPDYQGARRIAVQVVTSDGVVKFERR